MSDTLALLTFTSSLSTPAGVVVRRPDMLLLADELPSAESACVDEVPLTVFFPRADIAFWAD